MEPSERLALFKRIKDAYDALDREGLRHGKLPMHSTEFGFWGTTNMNDAYDFFSRIRLERFKKLVDLGCGDGRVVAIASLFTDAVGVEGNKELVDVGNEIFEELGLNERGRTALTPGEPIRERNVDHKRTEPERLRPNPAKESSATGRALLNCKNYYSEDFSQYDVIFMFPDNRYDDAMLKKLKTEFKGYLFIYNKVHLPPGIKAGKTYWIDQMPIASYPISVPDENLEL